MFYQYRSPPQPDNARDLYHYRRFKTYLMDPFRDAEPVPFFEHVATLKLPEKARMPPVQVYRFVGTGPVREDLDSDTQ